jgi:alpha-glucosidase
MRQVDVLVAAWLAVLAVGPRPAAAETQFLGPVDSWGRDGAGLVLVCGPARVRVDALTSEILRIRLAPTGVFEREFSYAVLPREGSPAPVDVAEEAGVLVLRTRALELRITKSPCRLEFRDARTGDLLHRDAPAFGMGWDGDRVFRWYERARDERGPERTYGLGEKTRGLEKGGNLYTMWNTDFPAYEGRTDPLYQSIPFTIGLHHGLAYGIFLDNTSRTTFNLGAGNTHDLAGFEAESGELDWYFIQGPGMADVVARYTLLTGRSPLPPLWSLGYQQSRWSYSPESEVRRIARTFREKDIPADVIYLDIDYMDGYRVFTWDRSRFPDPKGMVDDLAAQGFHLVVIIDPGIKIDPSYAACASGLDGDHFCRLPDGTLFQAEVWPGPCHFPDFTRGRTREWWGGLFRGLADDGIAGFWNDMNEPGVWGGTFPPLVRHDYDGAPTDHRAAHNVWGMEMARATREGVGALRPGERPFVLTRAGFAGIQRYSAVWTGDNVASWDHLRLSLPMLLNLGLSGVPFVGADIGGFVGAPTGELFTRWLEVGALLPLCRAHTEHGTPDQEPWSYGDKHEAWNREAIRLRYRLLPYLYKEFEEASRTGLPILRPLVLEFQEDPKTFGLADEFLVGDDLLAAPVVEEGARVRNVYFPSGRWLDWRTEEVHEGPVEERVDAPLGALPLFLREGAILPTWPVMSHVGEKPVDRITLDVFPSSRVDRDTLYEDDGHSLAYLRGVYRRTPIEVSRGAGTVFRFGAREGSYEPAERLFAVRLHDEPPPEHVTLDGSALGRSADPRGEGWNYSADSRVLEVLVRDRGVLMELGVEHELLH